MIGKIFKCNGVPIVLGGLNLNVTDGTLVFVTDGTLL